MLFEPIIVPFGYESLVKLFVHLSLFDRRRSNHNGVSETAEPAAAPRAPPRHRDQHGRLPLAHDRAAWSVGGVERRA
jgi:hypothetical protein